MAKQLISSSSTKSVYRDGNVAIKEFCEGFPKAEVLNEALCNARVEDLPGLHVPKILGVSVVDGKWSIMKEYIEGKTLEQLMEENLIDCYHITVIPTLLGAGIRLFENGRSERKLKLAGTRSYNGMVELVYVRR